MGSAFQCNGEYLLNSLPSSLANSWLSEAIDRGYSVSSDIPVLNDYTVTEKAFDDVIAKRTAASHKHLFNRFTFGFVNVLLDVPV